MTPRCCYTDFIARIIKRPFSIDDCLIVRQAIGMPRCQISTLDMPALKDYVRNLSLHGKRSVVIASAAGDYFNIFAVDDPHFIIKCIRLNKLRAII